jgi:hypothetical protein
VWCSGSTLFLQHHRSPPKKMPKVCNIVGGVVSPLLANIALRGMEEAIGVKYGYRGQLISKRAVVRYADDFVCFCERREDAEHLLPSPPSTTNRQQVQENHC